MDLLNTTQLISRLAISETSLKRLIRDRLFPAPRSILGRKKVWYRLDVDKWLVEQIGIPGIPGDQTESADHKSGNWLQSYVGDLAEWGRS